MAAKGADKALMEAVVAERAGRLVPDTYSPKLLATLRRSGWKALDVNGGAEAATGSDSFPLTRAQPAGGSPFAMGGHRHVEPAAAPVPAAALGQHRSEPGFAALGQHRSEPGSAAPPPRPARAPFGTSGPSLSLGQNRVEPVLTDLAKGMLPNSFIAPGVIAELFETEREGLLQFRALLEKEGVYEWRDPDSEGEVEEVLDDDSSEVKADKKLRSKERKKRRKQRAAEVPILLPFDPMEDIEELQSVLGESQAREVTWASERLDRYLLSCLFSRKFNLTRTLELLRKNTEWRREWGCEHNWPTFESIKNVLEKLEMLYCVPGTRGVRGGGVMYMEMRKHVPEEAQFTLHEFNEYNKYFAIQGPMMHGLDCQRNGAVFIQDLGDIGIKNTGVGTEFAGKEAQRMNTAMQDCFPYRVQSILILNAPGILRVMLTVAKAMGIKKKILDRISSAKCNEDLYEHVDRAQLPVHYGGEIEYDHAQFVEEVCAWNENWNSRHAQPSPSPSASASASLATRSPSLDLVD